jgi:phosphatidate cytidylyltransferase
LKFKNPYLLLLASGLIIAADSGAYAVGKYCGRHKLTKISPKKTWEGLLGGYITALVVAGIYVAMTKNNFSNLQVIMLTTATVIFAIIGDLFESLLKRITKVKDSSNILPGHGGILDRIDSFCAGIPIFMLILGTQIW